MVTGMGESEMRREELLDNLQKTSIIIRDTEKLMREKKNITTGTFKKVNPLYRIIILIIFYKLVGHYNIVHFFNRLTGGLYGRLYSKIYTITKSWDYLLALLLPDIFQLLVILIILKLLGHLSHLLKIKIYRKKLDEIEKRVTQNIEILNKQSVLPKTYWYSAAVDKLIAYLSNRRADDLKEAINIYEYELKQLEQIEKLNKMNESLKKELSRLNSEVKSAKSAAQTAKFMAWFSFFK